MATLISKEKSKFRRSAKWLTFRRKLRYSRKVDEITLQPLRPGFNLHHHNLTDDIATYEDISNECNFACLNKQTHKFIHWFYSYYEKDPAIFTRLLLFIEKMAKINGL